MKYIVAFLAVFRFSCSSDESAETSSCRILKYQKIYYNNAEYYKTEFVYENNRITKRLRTDYFNTFLIFEDSICYDSANRVTKIYYDIDNPAMQAYTEHDLFYYNGNSTNAYKRERYRNHTEWGIYVWVENISYDTSNRILNTVKTFTYLPEIGLEPDVMTTDYTYDAIGNLVKTIEVDVNNNYTRTTTVDRSNYDSHKNPFKHINVPFLEVRDLQYSKSNAQDVVTTIDYGSNTPSVSTWHSNFEYNEFDYPLIAEYMCN